MLPDEQPTVPSRTPHLSNNPPPGVWVAPSVEELQAKLPQYEVLETLGRGGMGAVYKARQKSLKRLVAIKILPLGMADDEFKFVERFQNEAQTMAQMNHPAIVSVYDFGETPDGLLYFVMEFVDGTDVQKMIVSSGRFSSEHALAITAHVCDALSYAHKRGVIHRDIKPANILIDQEGHIKVADFGLAKMNDPAQTSGLTKTNMAMGTPDYVAPEVLSTGMVADHRADIYAVGVMLYQMLTGEVPRGMFKLPSQKGIGCDERFDAIICKAMEQDREDRYQSAMDVRHALDVILTTPQPKDDGTGIVSASHIPQKPVAKGPRPSGEKSAPPPQEPAPQQAPAQEATTAPKATAQPKKQSPATMWLSIGGILAVLSVAGFLILGGKPKPQERPIADNASATAPSAKTQPPSKVREMTGTGKVDANSVAATPSEPPAQPNINTWQDVTASLREKARHIPGLVAEADAVRLAPNATAIQLRIAEGGARAIAVRLTHSGDGQITWRNAGGGSAYALCQRTQTIFQRHGKDAPEPTKLRPDVPHPIGYVHSGPHQLTMTLQGPVIRAWGDGLFIGEASDESFAGSAPELYITKWGEVRKVEICDLSAQGTKASSPPANADWRDVTSTLRESVAKKTGYTVDAAGVTRASGAPIGDTMVMGPSEKDRAVRVRYVGQMQVSLWIKSGAGSAYVLAARDRVMIKRQAQKSGEADSVLPSVTHPAGFDPAQPHELMVAVRGAALRVWLDGRNVGETEDAAIRECSFAIVPMKDSTVQKVEVAELADASPDAEGAEAQWQPIFNQPSDFGGDLRGVEFRDGATFIKGRTFRAPADPAIVGIRSTMRYLDGDRTGSLMLRSTEAAPFGEEDFALTAFIAPKGGALVVKMRDRPAGISQLGRHDFPLSSALKQGELFTFELRAEGGKITVSINRRQVGSLDDAWTGATRRFGITPSNTEMTEFRDVAVRAGSPR
jgi:serine/threonine protein kinase